MSAVKRHIFCFMLLAPCLPAASASTIESSKFGEPYSKHQPVTQQLSQVIFYRPLAEVTANGGATVYIDGKMHTSLLPGGYTSFCVPPGIHSLGVRLSRFLPAAGEERALFLTTMKPGRTYFLRVDEQALLEQPPEPVRVLPGEKEMQHTRRQAHLLSRATSVIPCAFDYARAQPMIDYLLPNTSLFIDNTTLSQQGREAISDLAVQIRRNHNWINQLRVVFGAELANGRPQREAQIRQALIDAAIAPNTIVFDQAMHPQQNMLILQVN
jgi:OOP family OmpA-OmpF porin